MSEAKHTPGPWEIVPLSGYGGPFAIRMAYQSENPKASRTYYGVQAIGTEANAKLIAAAPELLTACQEFVRKVESGEAKSVKSYEQMKAAIAAAKGGAS